MQTTLVPVILEGQTVRLEPMSAAHLSELCAAGLFPELWQWTVSRVCDESDMAAYVGLALEEQARGLALPFVTRLRGTGEVVGSTRFGNIALAHGRVEIGWTWLTPAAQRTAANTEAKYLMLEHAFETLGCTRVEFKTDARNARSRAAIARLGAGEEGTLRSHMRTEDGRLRDTVYFSILATEWPAVRARLRARLYDAPPQTTPFR